MPQNTPRRSFLKAVGCSIAGIGIASPRGRLGAFQSIEALERQITDAILGQIRDQQQRSLRAEQALLYQASFFTEAQIGWLHQYYP